MIDEKGRLFGKINLVDLLIIIIILAAGIFFALRLFGPESSSAQTQSLTLSLYTETCPTFVAEQLTAGDVVFDSTDNVDLGTLSGWETGEATDYELGLDGEYYEVPVDGYCHLTMNIAAEGVIGEHGVTIGGTLFGIGHTITIYAGDCKLYLKVSAIEPAA